MDEQTEQEVTAIYEQALNSLSMMAANTDDLHPYAFTSIENSEGQMIATDPGMETDEAITTLYRGLRKFREESDMIALAVITDVTLSNPESGETLDAIHVAVEHRSGFAMGIVVPYEMGESGREFASPHRMAIEPQVFTEGS